MALTEQERQSLANRYAIVAGKLNGIAAMLAASGGATSTILSTAAAAYSELDALVQDTSTDVAD
jgi:DNA-binding FrmR family transcriptional regulator